MLSHPEAVEELFDAVREASTVEIERQLGTVDASNTFSGDNPLSPLQAYMPFLLQYRINPRCDSWLILEHVHLRELQDRQKALFAWAKSCNFAQSLIAARVHVAEHFVSAQSSTVPSVDTCMYLFKVKDFPGLPPTPGQHYAWAHYSDRKSTVGICPQPES